MNARLSGARARSAPAAPTAPGIRPALHRPPQPGRFWYRPATAGWLIAVAIAYTAFYFVSDYDLFKISRVLTTAVVVASLVLLTGRTGQISAGQGALAGLGAYLTAVLMVKAAVPVVIAVLAAVIGCFLVGLLIGLPALRIGGLNLGLVTIVIAVIFPLVVARLDAYTGGSTGLALPPLHAPPGFAFSDAQWAYLVDLVVLAVVLLALGGLTRGRVGRAMDALRTHRVMAAATGVPVARFAVFTAGISSAVAGLGGALNALTVASVTPDTYSVGFSLALLTGAVVGGLRSWAGALVGAAFVVYLPDLIAARVDPQSAGQWAQVGYAVVLLLTIYFAPEGLAGRLGRLGRWLRPRSGIHPLVGGAPH